VSEVKEIPEEIVEAAWTEIGALSPDQAMGEMQRLMRVQEPLFTFVMTCAEDLSQDARELCLYMAVVVYRMYEMAFPPGLPRARPKDVAKAYEANLKWLEQAAGAHERLLMERILPNFDLRQPAVLGYVGECVFEPEDETLELSEEDQGQLFLVMKTLVDALDEAAARQKRSSARKGKRSRKKPTGPPIYQIKVTLNEIRPPIWRRLLVPGDVSFATLHEVIQVAMGWGDCHLHAFAVGGEQIGVPDPEWDDDEGVVDERSVKLADAVPQEKQRFRYTYDFGDDWEHTILVEKILPPDLTLELPLCVKGKRACPPEDCGGSWGYLELLETLADPEDPEHEEMLEWVGGELDPEAFDADVVNEALRDFIDLPE
jgi:hypothetical protein